VKELKVSNSFRLSSFLITFTIKWNPVKELKGRPGTGRSWACGTDKWNPVKELKGVTFIAPEASSSTYVWNPVKELKGKGMPLIDSDYLIFGFLWNPVKELKDPITLLRTRWMARVESGEGIESSEHDFIYPGVDKWNPVKELKGSSISNCPSANFSVESGEGIERVRPSSSFRLSVYSWNPVKELKDNCVTELL